MLGTDYYANNYGRIKMPGTYKNVDIFQTFQIVSDPFYKNVDVLNFYKNVDILGLIKMSTSILQILQPYTEFIEPFDIGLKHWFWIRAKPKLGQLKSHCFK